MRYTVFDIETDGLLETVTKIHCLSYQIVENGERIEKGSITDYQQIKDFILKQEILVGHNIIRYDIPVLEKLLNIVVNNRLVDTLGLSWYLYPMRIKHGLEKWGDELGVPKPVILDWKNLKIEDYIHRCESDVEINTRLFSKQLEYLNILYNADIEDINSLINYLGFKLDCAREQEEVGCRLDKQLVFKSLQELEAMRQEKEEALIQAMPRDVKYKEVKKPSKMYKMDGSLSKRGESWLQLLDEYNLPEDEEGPIMVQISDEPGNPGSHSQLKDWLFSLGWQPKTFEFRKNTAGEVNKVPQVYVDDEVCDSIKELYEVEPALENLDMLSLIKHRIGIFESYISTMDDKGITQAKIHGFTNTLRFRHMKPIVNLPKIFKFYGKQIRGAIIAPNESYLLCGSDMSSLEDTTKQHYMYFFDPEYVMQMRIPGFDPHLDIGVLAKMLSEEESNEFKRIKKKQSLFDKGEGPEPTSEEHKLFAKLNQIRGNAKIVNFAGVYGAGPPKIAQTSGMPLQQAQKLHSIYWKRNKAVKDVEKSCEVKTIGDQMWQRNPVSGFWYSLRYMEDRFSTLNQGTGVFCFDLWVREVRSRGIKIILQYHDEIVFAYPKGKEREMSKILKDSIVKVNNTVNLNVPLGISVEFGPNYAKIH